MKKLNTYNVCFLEGTPQELNFNCQAEDEGHAKEQCINAYPKAYVTQIQLLETRKPKLASLFTVSFTINHDYEDTGDIPIDDILNVMEKRLEYLKKNRDKVRDAAEFYDTCEY